MKYERIDIRVEGSIESAYLQIYALDESKELLNSGSRPVVIICPGGAYGFTSDREAEPIAMKYLAEGIHAAILRYSVAPSVYPTALLELAKAVLFLRGNGAKYHINKKKIFLQGFSAGGHLVASYGTMWQREFFREKLTVSLEELRPNGMILSYPVITSGRFTHEESMRNLLGNRYEELREEMSLELQVNENTPPTFLWHTIPDPSVSVENTILFMQALRQKNIFTEAHLYPIGGHGLALASQVTASEQKLSIQEECQGWIQLAIKFVSRNSYCVT